MSRIIYIDTYCKVHAQNVEGYRQLEVDMLDGFCDEYIEGLIVVPEGCTAIHPDGRTLKGPTVSPFKDSTKLDAAQRECERQQLADYKAACERMGIVV